MRQARNLIDQFQTEENPAFVLDLVEKIGRQRLVLWMLSLPPRQQAEAWLKLQFARAYGLWLMAEDVERPTLH